MANSLVELCVLWLSSCSSSSAPSTKAAGRQVDGVALVLLRGVVGQSSRSAGLLLVQTVALLAAGPPRPVHVNLLARLDLLPDAAVHAPVLGDRLPTASWPRCQLV
ncbi:hypothetical protein F441_06472 [Phytophthora nicotianae CJ01A1]|uniref:Secreted protein n=5 Tax=Phytophthora nicotianae TaxID=4792 RepID=W2RDG4_PHYN3|nr:hypothetical protein PPTG_20948 [Phytophthora nicotianae INRA-310]ETI55382.1 hypothetical protein F443_01926 [Phytophthora nicotianae P1569]ETO78544.1 hypothetical protein F444_06528 [Phytophthora nicotianae P1976]ETP19541.1 hypothetical protein F441_06472 [Phytophthora nicotianae CJ01A1]ETP47552.1 hypothetical protein F442_06510 [Phytophthora nicotianae P10297]ETN22719.1 hypothetical protein PPTG_20948 [Phytophthora nicotianae INRA-310]